MPMFVFFGPEILGKPQQTNCLIPCFVETFWEAILGHVFCMRDPKSFLCQNCGAFVHVDRGRGDVAWEEYGSRLHY